MALLLKHQTVQEFVARVREAYRDGDPARIIRIARFLIARVQAGDITEAQIRTAFGINVTQWNTLKDKMKGYIDADNVVKSAVGE